MKKLVLAIAIIMSMLLQVNAQLKKVKFGVKAGVNFANNSGNGIEFLSYGDTNTANSKLGMSIGGFFEYSLSDKFSLQPEVLYSQQGHREKISDFKHQIRLGYINIPVLAKYYVTDKMSLEFGPQLGFLTSADHNDKFDDNEEETEDVKEYFKSTDLGLNFGINYQLENGLGINARYSLGITDIIDFSYNYIQANRNIPTKVIEIAEDNNDNFELKNRVFNISLFYTF